MKLPSADRRLRRRAAAAHYQVTDRSCISARRAATFGPHRCCPDAIERDQQEIELEAPPTDPLHQFVAAADGQFHHREMEDHEVYMVKRPWMAGLAGATLAPLSRESRLRESGSSRPLASLGLHVGEQKYLLTVNRRGVRVDLRPSGAGTISLAARPN